MVSFVYLKFSCYIYIVTKLNIMATETKRKLYEIAKEIRSDWKNVYFGAKPYLSAMETLSDVNDFYGHEQGDGIVLRFLANAQTWRGEVARRIKKELNQMCK